MSALFLATPFAGYERPYMERWCLAYRVMAEGLEAKALWFYNGGDEAFDALLRQRAASMPIPVEVMWEPLPVIGNSAGVIKNNMACMAHSHLHQELWERDPEALVLVHESDVTIPPGGIERLMDGIRAHPGLGALSAAVPEPRSSVPVMVVGTMAWRIQPRHDGAYTVPGDGPTVDYYEPELSSGIEIADAVPFGALLVRLRTFREVPLKSSLFPGMGFDQEWCQNLLYQANLPVAIDWGVWCGHIRPDFDPAFEDLRLKTTTAAPTRTGLA